MWDIFRLLVLFVFTVRSRALVIGRVELVASLEIDSSSSEYTVERTYIFNPSYPIPSTTRSQLLLTQTIVENSVTMVDERVWQLSEDVSHTVPINKISGECVISGYVGKVIPGGFGVEISMTSEYWPIESQYQIILVKDIEMSKNITMEVDAFGKIRFPFHFPLIYNGDRVHQKFVSLNPGLDESIQFKCSSRSFGNSRINTTVDIVTGSMMYSIPTSLMARFSLTLPKSPTFDPLTHCCSSHLSDASYNSDCCPYRPSVNSAPDITGIQLLEVEVLNHERAAITVEWNFFDPVGPAYPSRFYTASNNPGAYSRDMLVDFELMFGAFSTLDENQTRVPSTIYKKGLNYRRDGNDASVEEDWWHLDDDGFAGGTNPSGIFRHRFVVNIASLRHGQRFFVRARFLGGETSPYAWIDIPPLQHLQRRVDVSSTSLAHWNSSLPESDSPMAVGSEIPSEAGFSMSNPMRLDVLSPAVTLLSPAADELLLQVFDISEWRQSIVSRLKVMQFPDNPISSTSEHVNGTPDMVVSTGGLLQADSAGSSPFSAHYLNQLNRQSVLEASNSVPSNGFQGYQSPLQSFEQLAEIISPEKLSYVDTVDPLDLRFSSFLTLHYGMPAAPGRLWGPRLRRGAPQLLEDRAFIRNSTFKASVNFRELESTDVTLAEITLLVEHPGTVSPAGSRLHHNYPLKVSPLLLSRSQAGVVSAAESNLRLLRALAIEGYSAVSVYIMLENAHTLRSCPPGYVRVQEACIPCAACPRGTFGRSVCSDYPELHQNQTLFTPAQGFPQPLSTFSLNHTSNFDYVGTPDKSQGVQNFINRLRSVRVARRRWELQDAGATEPALSVSSECSTCPDLKFLFQNPGNHTLRVPPLCRASLQTEDVLTVRTCTVCDLETEVESVGCSKWQDTVCRPRDNAQIITDFEASTNFLNLTQYPFEASSSAWSTAFHRDPRLRESYCPAILREGTSSPSSQERAYLLAQQIANKTYGRCPKAGQIGPFCSAVLPGFWHELDPLLCVCDSAGTVANSRAGVLTALAAHDPLAPFLSDAALHSLIDELVTAAPTVCKTAGDVPPLTVLQECTCQARFASRSCKECSAGYFGQGCARTCRCQNGAHCDSGLGGTGACECPLGFAGLYCQHFLGAGRLMSSGTSWTHAESTGSLFTNGGMVKISIPTHIFFILADPSEVLPASPAGSTTKGHIVKCSSLPAHLMGGGIKVDLTVAGTNFGGFWRIKPNEVGCVLEGVPNRHTVRYLNQIAPSQRRSNVAEGNLNNVAHPDHPNFLQSISGVLATDSVPVHLGSGLNDASTGAGFFHISVTLHNVTERIKEEIRLAAPDDPDYYLTSLDWDGLSEEWYREYPSHVSDAAEQQQQEVLANLSISSNGSPFPKSGRGVEVDSTASVSISVRFPSTGLLSALLLESIDIAQGKLTLRPSIVNADTTIFEVELGLGKNISITEVQVPQHIMGRLLLACMDKGFGATTIDAWRLTPDPDALLLSLSTLKSQGVVVFAMAPPVGIPATPSTLSKTAGMAWGNISPDLPRTGRILVARSHSQLSNASVTLSDAGASDAVSSLSNSKSMANQTVLNLTPAWIPYLSDLGAHGTATIHVPQSASAGVKDWNVSSEPLLVPIGSLRRSVGKLKASVSSIMWEFREFQVLLRPQWGVGTGTQVWQFLLAQGAHLGVNCNFRSRVHNHRSSPGTLTPPLVVTSLSPSSTADAAPAVATTQRWISADWISGAAVPVSRIFFVFGGEFLDQRISVGSTVRGRADKFHLVTTTRVHGLPGDAEAQLLALQASSTVCSNFRIQLDKFLQRLIVSGSHDIVTADSMHRQRLFCELQVRLGDALTGYVLPEFSIAIIPLPPRVRPLFVGAYPIVPGNGPVIPVHRTGTFSGGAGAGAVALSSPFRLSFTPDGGFEEMEGLNAKSAALQLPAHYCASVFNSTPLEGEMQENLDCYRHFVVFEPGKMVEGDMSQLVRVHASPSRLGPHSTLFCRLVPGGAFTDAEGNRNTADIHFVDDTSILPPPDLLDHYSSFKTTCYVQFDTLSVTAFSEPAGLFSPSASPSGTSTPAATAVSIPSGGEGMRWVRTPGSYLISLTFLYQHYAADSAVPQTVAIRQQLLLQCRSCRFGYDWDRRYIPLPSSSSNLDELTNGSVSLQIRADPPLRVCSGRGTCRRHALEGAGVSFRCDCAPGYAREDCGACAAGFVTRVTARGAAFCVSIQDTEISSLSELYLFLESIGSTMRRFLGQFSFQPLEASNKKLEASNKKLEEESKVETDSSIEDSLISRIGAIIPIISEENGPALAIGSGSMEMEILTLHAGDREESNIMNWLRRALQQWNGTDTVGLGGIRIKPPSSLSRNQVLALISGLFGAGVFILLLYCILRRWFGDSPLPLSSTPSAIAEKEIVEAQGVVNPLRLNLSFSARGLRARTSPRDETATTGFHGPGRSAEINFYEEKYNRISPRTGLDTHSKKAGLSNRRGRLQEEEEGMSTVAAAALFTSQIPLTTTKIRRQEDVSSKFNFSRSLSAAEAPTLHVLQQNPIHIRTSSTLDVDTTPRKSTGAKSILGRAASNTNLTSNISVRSGRAHQDVETGGSDYLARLSARSSSQLFTRRDPPPPPTPSNQSPLSPTLLLPLQKNRRALLPASSETMNGSSSASGSASGGTEPHEDRLPGTFGTK